MGQALHHFQDSYSHAGFSPPEGHLRDPEADTTGLSESTIERAKSMLMETLSIMERVKAGLSSDPSEVSFPPRALELMEVFLAFNANITDCDIGKDRWDVEISGGVAGFVAACQKLGYTVYVNGVKQ